MVWLSWFVRMVWLAWFVGPPSTLVISTVATAPTGVKEIWFVFDDEDCEGVELIPPGGTEPAPTDPAAEAESPLSPSPPWLTSAAKTVIVGDTLVSGELLPEAV